MEFGFWCSHRDGDVQQISDHGEIQLQQGGSGSMGPLCDLHSVSDITGTLRQFCCNVDGLDYKSIVSFQTLQL